MASVNITRKGLQKARAYRTGGVENFEKSSYSYSFLLNKQGKWWAETVTTCFCQNLKTANTRNIHLYILIKTLEHIVIMSNSIHYVALFRLESLSNFEVLDQIECLNKVVALQGPQFLRDKIL